MANNRRGEGAGEIAAGPTYWGLAGKVALVTGGSRGIGRAITERLAEDGASVVVNYGKNADEAKKVVAGIEAKGGKAVAIEADVSGPALVDAAFRELGRLDILVNNAGMADVAPIEAVDEKHVRVHWLQAAVRLPLSH
ncbi:MAG: SDR family NAD(P)-dependent oxidoreductase [Blastocatellia bacterium]